LPIGKYSSLACPVPCAELTGEGKTEVFPAMGACYLAFVTIAGFPLRRPERRFHVPGFGAR
jgi:polar amino acid transport system permease protein